MIARRFIYPCLILVTVLSLLAPQFFQLAQAAQKQSTTYQVDTATSRVYIKVGTATRLGHPHGIQGNLKSGQVTLSGDGELVFDMASFVADTQEARERLEVKGKVSESEAKKVTAAMLGADVLNIEKFPTATYRIIAIQPLDKQAAGEPGSYQLEGRFSLHGTEQKLQFKAKAEKTDKAGVIKLKGSFSIKQSDYGITPFSTLGGLAKVADELEIFGDLVLNAASSK